MLPIKGIVICVGYDDILAITLHRNARFMTEIVVVTHPNDYKTKEVVAKVPSARIYETDAFYRYGAQFNKGLAMEEGFDVLGRDGWILVWDADILLSDKFDLPSDLKCGNLYSAPRVFIGNPKDYNPDVKWEDWRYNPRQLGRMFPGYFHLFHANDPALNPLPWYDVTYRHAGGGDGFFQSRWSLKKKNKLVLPFSVLHLGPPDTNWFGRASERLDGGRPTVTEEEMSRFKASDVRQKDRDTRVRKERDRTTSTFWLDKERYEEHLDIPGHSRRSWIYPEDF